jgi:hypothetical protein
MVLTKRQRGIQVAGNDTPFGSSERTNGSKRASRICVMALAHAIAPSGSSLWRLVRTLAAGRFGRGDGWILQAAREQLAGGIEVVSQNRVDRVVEGGFDGGAVLRFDFENLPEGRAAIGCREELLQHFEARALAGSRRRRTT